MDRASPVRGGRGPILPAVRASHGRPFSSLRSGGGGRPRARLRWRSTGATRHAPVDRQACAPPRGAVATTGPRGRPTRVMSTPAEHGRPRLAQRAEEADSAGLTSLETRSGTRATMENTREVENKKGGTGHMYRRGTPARREAGTHSARPQLSTSVGAAAARSAVGHNSPTHRSRRRVAVPAAGRGSEWPPDAGAGDSTIKNPSEPTATKACRSAGGPPRVPATATRCCCSIGSNRGEPTRGHDSAPSGPGQRRAAAAARR